MSPRSTGFLGCAVAGAWLLAFAGTAGAQDPTGRISGRIIDGRTGQGLADAGVQVVGALPGATTTSGAASGVDGRYLLHRVRAGTVTLHVRRLGYQPKTVTGIVVPDGGAVEQDITLDPATVQLTAVTVSAESERGSVNEALDQQKHAAGVVNAITAEQIAKSPDGDAAQAVQRVSGVTVQGGKYVFVRGLGERYTTTSLNGARLPSPEPERKVVPLDLFPSGILQSITTTKTFTPDLAGDFSGAAVDIRTREFPAERQVTYSASVGFNTATSGRDIWYAPGVGGEQFAMAGDARFLPGGFRPLNTLDGISPAERNALIGSFRNVWQAGQRSGRPNSAVGVSVGGSDPVFGHQLGYLLSASYGYAQEAKVGEQRALARPTSTPGVAEAYNEFTGSSGRTSAQFGGLANLSAMLGTHSRLSFNNTYNRTSDNDARVERGFDEEYATEFEIQRLDYVERTMWTSQLAGEHTLGRHGVTWSATGASVQRDQPDRSELVYMIEDGTRLWLNSHPEAALRTFAALAERSFEGSANYRLNLGRHNVRAGVLGRTLDRGADTRAYYITAPVLSDADRALPPEQLFSGRHVASDANVFQLGSPSAGGSYAASDRLQAGYVMAEVGLLDRLRVIGGARMEQSRVRVDAVSNLGEEIPSARDFTDVLPSLALTYSPSDAQNVRLSVSRTLARPEYRELAAIRGREVIGAVDIRGNPALERTLIGNADLRWEWYPRAGETMSVALFGKRFDRPIERVVRASGAAPVIEWVNAMDATVAGIELEVRSALDRLHSSLSSLSGYANATVMRSTVHVQEDDAAATGTSQSRSLAGQAPYVTNLGLTYTAPSTAGLNASVLFNRVGARILYTGSGQLANVVEQARNVVDFSFRFPLHGTLSGRLDAKNLLDTDYLTTQGNVTHERYRAGRSLSIGVTVRP